MFIFSTSRSSVLFFFRKLNDFHIFDKILNLFFTKEGHILVVIPLVPVSKQLSDKYPTLPKRIINCRKNPPEFFWVREW